MGKNFLKIKESVSFSLINPSLIKIKDDYEGAFRPTDPNQQTHISGMGTTGNEQQIRQDGLLARIAATHSGIITRNNGFYLPDRMSKGASSFTDNYSKPVLLHHNSDTDPVGRIVEAKYYDTSGATLNHFDGYQIKNKTGKIIATINEAFIKDFVSNKMPYGQQVDVVRNVLRDSNLLEDKNYEGLGHIQIVARISDLNAIIKLLDGRYLTGSVGVTTNKAVCSICKQDWADSGVCEHKPGQIYDDAKCFIIAGDLSYNEYSFVNTPADRHSQVLELNYNGNTTIIDSINNEQNRVYEVNLEFPQYDSEIKEEIRMADNSQQILDSTLSDTHKTEIEDGKTVSIETSIEAEKIEENIEDKAEHTEENNIENKTEDLDDFLIRVLDSEKTLSDDDEVKLYDALWEEVLDALNDKELFLEDSNVEDAKLSTEKRNKLPKSSFCGPNRSFPVTDCAHVTAARRLIDRAKVSDATKSKIMACINRKAKAMGCETKDAAEVVPQATEEAVVTTQDSMQHSMLLRQVLSLIDEDKYYAEEGVLEDEELEMLQALVKRLANYVGKDSLTKALVAEKLVIDPASEAQLLDEIIQQETKIGDLNDSLRAVRKEYAILFQDMESLQDQLIDVKSETRKVKENHLSTMIALKDLKVEEVSFTEISDADLDNKLLAISKEVNLVKITDKLGNGMAREPIDLVDSSDEIIHDDHNTQKFSVEDALKIQEHHAYLLFSKGAIAAEAFLNKMKQEGKLPQG